MRGRTVAAVAALAVLTGCSYDGAESLPLPGATGGHDTYAVTMTFTDATNLVPKETCRTNDTVVGSVASVELDHQLQARVVCRIRNSVHIPANVVATLRETSLLGERFVGLDVPPGAPAAGRLAPGATIPIARTVVNPDTEIVLGALSQVLNGGSLGSISTISHALITALDGRTGTARQAAERLAATLKSFDDHRQDLVDTLDELDHFTQTLAKQKAVVAGALDQVPQGLAVLDRQRPRLTRALQRLTRLSAVVVPLVRQSKANAVADLQHLRPVLSQLASAGDELSLSLERLISFPFNDNTLQTIKGDYSGAYVQANFDLDSVNRLLGDLLNQGGGSPGTPGLPGIPGLPTLPGLPKLNLPSLPGTSGRTGVPGVVDQDQPSTLGELLAGP